MKFRTNAKRASWEDEADNVVDMGEGAAPGKRERGRIFLERWKARASSRRARFARELLGGPLSVQRIENLNVWLRNLESRKAWLEARLEHIVGVESILRAAIQGQPGSAQGSRNSSSPQIAG
jgi:hypothetical protein